GANNPQAQALRPDDITVPKLLQGAGYRTSLVGKWGLGDIGPAEMGLPHKQGFDEFFGYLNQGRRGWGRVRDHGGRIRR
ncbi:MAG: Arylsulfatase, partial [Planctomycetota bacterium]